MSNEKVLVFWGRDVAEECKKNDCEIFISVPLGELDDFIILFSEMRKRRRYKISDPRVHLCFGTTHFFLGFSNAGLEREQDLGVLIERICRKFCKKNKILLIGSSDHIFSRKQNFFSQSHLPT